MSVVITDPPRVSPDVAAAFAPHAVATVREAQGRCGLFGSFFRPIYPQKKKVEGARTRLKRGELGLAIYGMREELARKGLENHAFGAG